MKNLSAISKKGIIVISAVIMIIVGALLALLPSTSQACGTPGMGERTSYVNVPMLNNTGKTMTIRSMFIDTPNVTNVCKRWMHNTCKTSDDELRVKTISFGGVTYYTAGSTGHSHCHRYGSAQDIVDKTIGLDTVGGTVGYPFSGTKVKCKIAFDVIEDELPTGTGAAKEYIIKLYFRFDGDTEDRMNEIKFNL